MKLNVMIEAAPISFAGKVARRVFDITKVLAVCVFECLAIHTTICCSYLTLVKIIERISPHNHLSRELQVLKLTNNQI
jgi:hypothetical protein